MNETVRKMVEETSISVTDLVYPMFITEEENAINPIASMPGINQYSINCLSIELDRVVEAGIRSVLLFGIPSHKDLVGSEAYNDNGVVQRAISYIKKNYPGLMIIADICLCEYTSHGHCGVICDGQVSNDETLPLLAKAALSCVRAGADMIAPSDMMDGHVGAIRKELDENGFIHTPIMAYSAKYASAYYAPFRDAAQSAPGFGDRKSYQMNYSNVLEALREVQDDIEEGADIVMVKPALAYLDVIRAVTEETNYPVAAYNVSGEYSMVKAAALNGWIDEKKIVLENITAMKRAGANIIITYHALDVARWLRE